MARKSLRSGIALAAFLGAASAQAQASKIKIHIEGMRSGQGHLAINVFPAAEAKAFPGKAEKAAESLYIPLDGKTEIEVETKELPPGDYAVALLHDENSDKKLETNFVGIPKEGFGFSKNPRVILGPPRFSRARIEHKEGEEISIKVRYLL